jgi:hypothetical protein
LSPAVDASFGSVGVSIKDMSVTGARVKHDQPLEAGAKSVLRFRTEERSAVSFEAMVVWTQKVAAEEESGQYVSGVKLFADKESVGDVILGFGDRRSVRIEENRTSDRFLLNRLLKGELGAYGFVRLEDLSSRGARIETTRKIAEGTESTLRYGLPDHSFEVSVDVEVVWSQIKAVWSAEENRYHAGLRIVQRHELQRLAIGHLRETAVAVQDTHSLKLKLRLQPVKARLLAMGRSVSDRASLVEAVRLELTENPEGASKWRERAAALQQDPSLRGTVGPISQHPEALAVWAFLDRSVDPSLVALSFGIR